MLQSATHVGRSRKRDGQLVGGGRYEAIFPCTKDDKGGANKIKTTPAWGMQSQSIDMLRITAVTSKHYDLWMRPQ